MFRRAEIVHSLEGRRPPTLTIVTKSGAVLVSPKRVIKSPSGTLASLKYHVEQPPGEKVGQWRKTPPNARSKDGGDEKIRR